MSVEETAGIDRRDALTLLGAGGLALVAAAARGQAGDAKATEDLSAIFGWDAKAASYTLPKLPYAFDDLEPHIDKATMEIHHGKHHAAYVAGLNKALGELKKAREGGDFSLVKHWSRELAFHGGGHVNHCLFWHTMAPPGPGVGGAPPADSKITAAIARDFGSFEAFIGHFQAAAVGVEGSGWAWLVYDHIARRLMIQQMEKQQNLLVTAVSPLLGCDVWEHAYYLKHQNRRADYVKAWMNVINWGAVERLFEHAGG